MHNNKNRKLQQSIVNYFNDTFSDSIKFTMLVIFSVAVSVFIGKLKLIGATDSIIDIFIVMEHTLLITHYCKLLKNIIIK